MHINATASFSSINCCVLQWWIIISKWWIIRDDKWWLRVNSSRTANPNSVIMHHHHAPSVWNAFHTTIVSPATKVNRLLKSSPTFSNSLISFPYTCGKVLNRAWIAAVVFVEPQSENVCSPTLKCMYVCLYTYIYIICMYIYYDEWKCSNTEIVSGYSNYNPNIFPITLIMRKLFLGPLMGKHRRRQSLTQGDFLLGNISRNYRFRAANQCGGISPLWIFDQFCFFSLQAVTSQKPARPLVGRLAPRWLRERASFKPTGYVSKYTDLLPREYLLR